MCMSVEVTVSSYLASGHELERAQRAPQVGDVVLKILEGIVDGDLNLRRRGAGRAVGSDLRVVSRHVGGWWSCRKSKLSWNSWEQIWVVGNIPNRSAHVSE